MTANQAALARGPVGGHVPGDGLLHPVMLAAIGLLLLNDHVLKLAHPGLVTGKLSDVAGLLFFPALLVAAFELASAAARREWRLGPPAVTIACAVTALAFAAVKLTPAGALAFGSVLGLAQALAAGLLAMATGVAPPRPAVAPVILDATDLIALVALVPAALIGRRRSVRLHGPDPHR